ncbi:MAG: hypothetical protein AB1758_36240, partial [Candidatus Eremiobacterota bacterium]
MTIMWVTSIIFLMMAVVGSGTIKTLNDSRREGDTSRVRYASFAGLQRALGELIYNADWPGPAWPQVVTGTLPQSPQLSYIVEVYNNNKGTGSRSAAGVNVPAGAVYIMCTGQDATVSSASPKTFGGMAGTAVRDRPSFDQAALGDTSLSLADSLTDAWDGSWGGYDPTKIKQKEGTIGSNGPLSLATMSKVDGDVEVVPPAAGAGGMIDTDGDGVPDTPAPAGGGAP